MFCFCMLVLCSSCLIFWLVRLVWVVWFYFVGLWVGRVGLGWLVLFVGFGLVGFVTLGDALCLLWF